jgi:hypothetical protein
MSPAYIVDAHRRTAGRLWCGDQPIPLSDSPFPHDGLSARYRQHAYGDIHSPVSDACSAVGDAYLSTLKGRSADGHAPGVCVDADLPASDSCSATGPANPCLPFTS